MIFQDIRTSVAKKTYIFVIFQFGGSGPPVRPLDPSMGHDARCQGLCIETPCRYTVSTRTSAVRLLGKSNLCLWTTIPLRHERHEKTQQCCRVSQEDQDQPRHQLRVFFTVSTWRKLMTLVGTELKVKTMNRRGLCPGSQRTHMLFDLPCHGSPTKVFCWQTHKPKS